MRVGVALPTNTELFDDRELSATLASLESAGVASVWVNDHLAMFPVGHDAYPYTADGTIDWDPRLPQYEALTTCAFVAARTSRLRIGTAVLVLPQRHPLAVAKAAVTLSTFSSGRFVLGVGAGWSRKEMLALGWDPRTRGARLEDGVRLMTDLWSGGVASRSRFWDLPPDLLFHPVPPERLRPTVLVGGVSDAALRRVARLGCGWISVSDDSAEAMARQAASLDGLRTRAGHDVPAVLKIAMPGPDITRAEIATRAAAAAGWDEICFEFRAWDHAMVRALGRSCVRAEARAGQP